MARKAELRRLIKEEIRKTDRLRESALICSRLERLVPATKMILAFEPLADEPDISPLIERLRSEKRLALVVGEHHDPKIEPLELPLAMALVPGRAFDRTGSRLGRGGGTFDRLLAVNDCVRVGVGFDCQLVDELPAEEHDVPMDQIVTASEHIVCSRS